MKGWVQVLVNGPEDVTTECFVRKSSILYIRQDVLHPNHCLIGLSGGTPIVEMEVIHINPLSMLDYLQKE